MREFAFGIDHDPGIDPVMGVSVDHPSLVARGSHGRLNGDDFRRIERLGGSMAASMRSNGSTLTGTYERSR